ncbi:unnamed protein product [Brassica napus]|uniref:(rape) hypothetical protein n=1 Tax=Brassica napus TaxID=3708 RepID=A0A816PMS7_BRANA|nr:unnamed protein product [Brassica napus]
MRVSPNLRASAYSLYCYILFNKILKQCEEESGCERHLEAWRSRVEPVNYEGSRDFLSSPTMKQYSGVKKLEPVGTSNL